MKLNLKNKAKERKLSTATPFGGVSDQELLLQFHSRNWAQLSPLRRLWVMQEIENRRAKAKQDAHNITTAARTANAGDHRKA